MWTVKIKVGHDTEEIILSDSEHEIFEQSSIEAKRSFDLVPLGNGRTCAKGDIISSCKTIERDDVMTALMIWYGTYVWPNTNTLHGVENWRAYKTDDIERAFVELLIGEKKARGYITKAMDNFDKFPKELQEYLKRPSDIYKHFSEIENYMNTNILKKSDIIPEEFIKQFKAKN